MGRYSADEYVFYHKLDHSRSADGDFFWTDRLFCWLLTKTSKDFYSLPYLAIRKSGIDFILELYEPRRSFDWEELLKVEASVSAYTFYLKTGFVFTVDFLGIDYVSVQAMKKPLTELGLLTQPGRK